MVDMLNEEFFEVVVIEEVGWVELMELLDVGVVCFYGYEVMGLLMCIW